MSFARKKNNKKTFHTYISTKDGTKRKSTHTAHTATGESILAEAAIVFEALRKASLFRFVDANVAPWLPRLALTLLKFY